MKNKPAKVTPSVVNPLQAVCGRADAPLHIGNVRIPCYVLENGTRVITELGVKNGVGLAKAGNRSIRAFLENLNLDPKTLGSKPLEHLDSIPFKRTEGPMASGYDARVLPMVWRSILKANDAGKLSKKHLHLVDHCRTMAYAVMDVGIVALVDEATGYQDIREKDELQRLLDLYIRREAKPHAKMFPMEFFEQVARLKNWKWVENPQMYRAIGHLINSLIYKRLPLGVLEALREVNPTNENGNRTRKHHQHLTYEMGETHLQFQVNACTAMMRGSSSWEGFLRGYERAFPRPNNPAQYDLIDEDAA